MEGTRAITWRTSSYSGNSGGQCVQVGAAARTIAVRDSKDLRSAILAFTPRQWRRFTDRVKAEGATG
jgi:Domain of unknown function (DUF397)